MKKNRASMLFIVSMLATGCATSTSTVNETLPPKQESEVQTTEPTATTEPESTKEAPLYTERPAKDMEEELGIESKKKEAFIEKYGQDVYDTALIYCSEILQINHTQEVDKSKFDKYREDYVVEELEIPSTFDDHIIPATYLRQKKSTKNDTVILIHGRGGTREINMSIGMQFLELGYNVLTIDLRSSGSNKAKFTTYGAWEKYDVVDCVDYIDERIDSNNKLILWGCSYGGAVCSVTLGTKNLEKKVDAAILDCALDSMGSMIYGCYVTRMNQPPLEDVKDYCDKFLNEFYGIRLEDANGQVQIADTKVPTLMFACTGDPTVPFYLTQSLFESIKETEKEFVTFSDKAHCMANYDHKDEYFSAIKKFLKKYT